MSALSHSFSTAFALLFAAGLVSLGGCAHRAAPGGRLEVEIAGGTVRGVSAEGVERWLGVPYAAPPVGERRWQPPRPAQGWRGVRITDRYGADCMQKPFPSDAAPLGTSPAEDCLYLNLWRPAAKPEAAAKLPVVVWIYGGGFLNGGASPPTYAGAALAKRGVVFVSFNYRLGRFGTFAHPALTRANGEADPIGNYGLMDQIAALRWVQDHVAAFGGDPANVTIMGESAGGRSVHALLTSPTTEGLFAKAIIMSGGDPLARAPDGAAPFAQAEAAGAAFGAARGIPAEAPDALERLRALPAESVLDGLNLEAIFTPGTKSLPYSSPFADGRVMVETAAAYAAQRYHHVPVMIGATDADIGGMTGAMVGGARRTARLLSAQGNPVWAYRFAYVAESLGASGAQHATDIPFFLDTAAIKYGAQTTARDTAVAQAIADMIARFAKVGDPNGKGLPAWPRYSTDNDMLMMFAPDGSASAIRDPWGPAIDTAVSR